MTYSSTSNTIVESAYAFKQCRKILRSQMFGGFRKAYCGKGIIEEFTLATMVRNFG